MGGRSRQQSTSTTTTTLPANQQRNVDTLMQAAHDIFTSGGPRFFPGQTYAPTSSQELQARQGAQSYATGTGQDFVNRYMGSERFWLDPANIFNPSNIPGFRAAQEGVTDLVTQNLMRNILPAIRGSSVATGGLGGSRAAIAEGLAVGDTSSSLSRVLADMNMQAYNQGLNMYNSAAMRAPGTYAFGLAPAETLGQVGAAYRGDVQKGIDESIARFNFNELRPILAAQTLQGLTGTAGQYGGTTTTESTQELKGGSSGILQGLGGALSLLSIMYPALVPGAAAKSGG